jgi:DNA/RNA-binding domain of Phe-tRNA-synthetase-like protein
VTVHFADGSESFRPLGEAAAENPEAGEVVLSDERKRVIARRWCWRQSDDSAARESTTDTIITVEAQHTDGRTDVEAAVRDLLALLGDYAAGEFMSGILGAERAAISG